MEQVNQHIQIRLRIPGLKAPVGLGTAVARVTKSVGISPCGGCAKRAAALDKRVLLTPRRGEK
jgi:hypothetical protein